MYFQVNLDEEMVNRIKSLMKKRECDEALKLIKERPSIIHIPKEFLDSWELIPDTRGLIPGRTICANGVARKAVNMGVVFIFI